MSAPIQNSAAHWQDMKKHLLATMPELEDDPDALLDTLEGCTDLHEQIAELIRSAERDKDFAAGTAEHIRKLQDRKAALMARHERKKQICLHYMEQMQIKRVDAPDMTITYKRTPAKVHVPDINKLPDRFCRFQREPNKVAIKAALELNTEVPGAVMDNGGATIQVKI